MKTDPLDHWLWARLAAVAYQQRLYGQALEYSDKSLALEPDCSLALWEKAEALYMLKRYAEAILIYKRITRAGVERVHFNMHGEGRSWARSVVSDSYYRVGRSYAKLSKGRLAARSIREALNLRGPGMRSLYTIAEVRATLAAVEALL